MPPKMNRPDLRHGWEVRMHHEMLDSDGLVLHPEKPEYAICPGCGATKPRFLLVDVSTLPPGLTNGDKWRCDGCWSSWERNHVRLPDGRVFDESIMYELMGAPAALVNEVRAAVASHRARYVDPPE